MLAGTNRAERAECAAADDPTAAAPLDVIWQCARVLASGSLPCVVIAGAFSRRAGSAGGVPTAAGGLCGPPTCPSRRSEGS